jgi:anti-anti-sigma regulatory factor
MRSKKQDAGARLYSVRTRGAWSIVNVTQEIDWQTDTKWVQQVVKDVCTTDRRNVALVLDKESHLHSKIVALLVACSRIVKEQGGLFGLLEPGAQVRNTLTVMKLVDRVVCVYDHESDLP